MRVVSLTCRAVALATTLSITVDGAAQDYPSRPIRIVVPYAPGGVADIAARVIGHKLGEHWKQQVVVENLTGGAGTIALDAVAKSAPDGYTLLGAVGADLAIIPHLYTKLAY
jgi:tripartite-type tricarboxylate transporter receptor subunit TctC